MRRFVPFIVTFVLVLGCTAVSQQKAVTAQPDNLEFHNLKVLPPNITHDELVATMRNFSRSLGTRCEHCHVQSSPPPKEQMDFASDAKEEKRVARTMMLMTQRINNDYVSKLEDEHGPRVTCGTCHRGKTVPENWQPPAPPVLPGAAPTPPPS
jgi:hypothetical protein